MEIGANIRPAENDIKSIFNPRLIEEVYLAEEYAFDSVRLCNLASQELSECGIQVNLGVCVIGVSGIGSTLKVSAQMENGICCHYETKYLFNCTYSGLNHIGGEGIKVKAQLKHEIAELALIEVPPTLKNLGVTVMDGPFFSIMPFPSRSLHTLTHVRYTPHISWSDHKGVNPYKKLCEYHESSRVNRMIMDVERYIPSIKSSKYIESLLEVKTVLVKNEGDDGRPILFEKSFSLPGLYSILGGKIDNIYDVLEKMDHEELL